MKVAYEKNPTLFNGGSYLNSPSSEGYSGDRLPSVYFLTFFAGPESAVLSRA